MLAVVFYHLGVPGFAGGFVGVDVFFVISGYLITGVVVHDLEQGEFSFSEFYGRRVRRIAPALLATLVGTALVALMFFAPVHLEAFGASLIAAVISVSNILFWTESGYFGAAAEMKPLLHTWSLGIEEQFYLMWPVSLVLLTRGPRWLIPAVSIALVALACVTAEIWLRNDPEAAFYLLPARLGELALGAALVWLPQNRGPELFRQLGFVAGLAFILYAAATFDERTPFPGIAALVPCIGTALVIGCRAVGPPALLLENSVARQIGRMSYSIYLVHWPVISFWHYYRYSPLTDLDRIGAVVATALLSAALFYVVERPFRLKHRGVWIVPPRRLFASIFSVSLALVGIGLGCLAAQGNILVPPSGTNHLEAALEDFQVHGPWLVEPAEADVLLIGDSHADHYTEAVVAAAANSGLAVTRSILPGCPPLLDQALLLDGADLRPEQFKCVQRMEAWIDEISRFQGDMVVLASRWSMLTEPSHYGRYRVRRHWLFVDPDDPNDLHGPRERFSNSIEATVDLILASGKKVVLLGQAPEIGTDLNTCYAAPGLLLPDPSQRCVSVSSTEMLERVAFSNGVFLLLQEKYPTNVETFLASAVLCPRGNCQIDAGGVLLYHNEDHLTKAASLYLATALKRQLATFQGS